MYAGVKTWNPFKGCLFDCSYCRPSFQQQAKRQKHNCTKCYKYVPHRHPERLNRIPSAETIFVCGNGDISFSRKSYTREIIKSIWTHNERCPEKTYYFQSKQPKYFESFTEQLPDNVIVLTTLETNRDDDYRKVSKAPLPSVRYQQLHELSYPRKVVTIEPVLDFDPDIFLRWIVGLNPEYVWLGFNSRPKQVVLPEPDNEKLQRFIKMLQEENISIMGKELRGLKTLLK
jgi:hypothetical protein